jgi:hypothetical protein
MATQFTGLLGDALQYMQDPNRTQALQGIGGLLQSGLTSIDESQAKFRDLNKRAFGDKKNPMRVTDQDAFDQLTEMTMNGPMAFAPAGITKKMATVVNPERIAYPGIYSNPRELVQEAASRVAPESPLLKQLFGVTREDLFDISQQGTRAGNITDVPFKTAANPKGAAHATSDEPAQCTKIAGHCWRSKATTRAVQRHGILVHHGPAV